MHKVEFKLLTELGSTLRPLYLRNVKRRALTLLEVMLGITLLLLVTGSVSWNLQRAIKKHKFRADISTVQMQLQLGHRLALNTGVDWAFQLIEEGKRFKIAVFSPHISILPPKPVYIESLQVLFNEQEIEQLLVYFSPTGYVEPKGRLELRSSSSDLYQEIILPACFLRYEYPDQEGPSYPSPSDISHESCKIPTNLE